MIRCNVRTGRMTKVQGEGKMSEGRNTSGETAQNNCAAVLPGCSAAVSSGWPYGLGSGELHELRKRAKNLDAVLRIGKSGITPSVLAEIQRQLSKNKLIKLKYLKSFLQSHDRKAVSERISNLTESVMVSQVGSVVTLYKPRNSGPVREARQDGLNRINKRQ